MTYLQVHIGEALHCKIRQLSRRVGKDLRRYFATRDSAYLICDMEGNPEEKKARGEQVNRSGTAMEHGCTVMEHGFGSPFEQANSLDASTLYY